jgi:hypothetical protein
MSSDKIPPEPVHYSCSRPAAPAQRWMNPVLALLNEATVARFFASQPVGEATEDAPFDDDEDLAERIDALEERLAQVEAAVGRPGGPTPAGLQESASVAESLGRIADALAPAPADTVGSPYVARRLGCTTVWVAEMARQGRVPKHCLVPGTGSGKPWKFFRRHIDKWIASR